MMIERKWGKIRVYKTRENTLRTNAILLEAEESGFENEIKMDERYV